MINEASGSIVIPKEFSFAIRNVIDSIIDVVGIECEVERCIGEKNESVYGSIKIFDKPIKTKFIFKLPDRYDKVNNFGLNLSTENFEGRFKFSDDVKRFSIVRFKYSVDGINYNDMSMQVTKFYTFGVDIEVLCIAVLSPYTNVINNGGI